MDNRNDDKFGEKLFSWQVAEFEKQTRDKRWYVAAILTALFFLLFSFYTSNFLFAVIVIVASLIIILNDSREPDNIYVQIFKGGVMIDRNFYDYDEFDNFAVLNKPHHGISKLYFEFKAFFKNRLSIPLDGQDAEQIRKTLLEYLPEDTERTSPPISETLAGILKL